jgi:hypothetical protein
MRLAIRFLLAHVIASFCLQLTLLVWVVIADEKLKPLRGVMAMLFSPILVPLPLLRIGPKMRYLGYGVYLAMYLTLFAAASFVLAWRASQKRRRVRGSKGQCVKCGYDLRATPDRCPECGTVLKTQPTA